ncbi:MAG: hypothetical protein JST92_06300 [Deltaproteobacteria bacterium]|nr:hypothetical protein [Deltaproteobacteria bacterium]
MSTTLSAVRLELPNVQGMSLRLDVLHGTVEVRDAQGELVRGKLAGLEAMPCERAGHRDEVKLQCSTSRIDAVLTEARGKRYLDLRELRGIPSLRAEDGSFEPVQYNPEELGLGSACPGDTFASKGECFMHQGELDRAEGMFLISERNADTRKYALVRRGDIAMMRGDPDQALALYHKAGWEGPWGRIATLRVCDLNGACFGDQHYEAFDTYGLPVPLRRELQMREVWTFAVLRRWSELSMLIGALTEAGGVCGDERVLVCRAATLELLQAKDAAPELALEAYLRLPNRTRGMLAASLSMAAAERAEQVGGNRFAATLLAATVRAAPPGEKAMYLHRTIELYQSFGDDVRARVIAEYARQEFPTGRWELREPKSPEVEEKPAPVVELDVTEAALATAQAVLSRARASEVGGVP